MLVEPNAQRVLELGNAKKNEENEEPKEEQSLEELVVQPMVEPSPLKAPVLEEVSMEEIILTCW